MPQQASRAADAPPEPPAARPLDMTLFLTVLALGAVVLLLLAVWQLGHVLLLAYGAILLAVLLRTGAVKLVRHAPFGPKVGVAVVLLGLVGAIGLVSWLLGPRIAAQFQALLTDLPSAIDGAVARIEQSRLGEFLVGGISVPGVNADASNMNLLGRVGGTLATVAGVLANVLIVVAAAVFLALDPRLYRRGALHLVPQAWRPRMDDVMGEIGEGLAAWMGGQLVIMVLVALLTSLGLWIVGVPLPIALGLIAGVTNVIPFVGPFIAAVPILLIALAQGVDTAMWAALVLLLIQQTEGNILVPMVQRRAADLPPALTIFAVVVAGVLFGPLGILLSAPLLIGVMVAVRRLYVEDALGDDADGDGDDDGGDGTDDGPSEAPTDRRAA